MKSLYESLLDDEDVVVDKLGMNAVIENWLKLYGIKNYKINKDNTINASLSHVIIKNYPEEEFPEYINFNKVSKDFRIISGKLKTLRGCPKEVKGNFICINCGNLTSLEGCPEKVSFSFECEDCDSLTSLEGCPEKIDGSFSCNNCENLTSLKGAPKEVGRDFDCCFCDSLTSLEGIPKEVGGNFWCRSCKKLNITKKDIEKNCNVMGNIIL